MVEFMGRISGYSGVGNWAGGVLLMAFSGMNPVLAKGCCRRERWQLMGSSARWLWCRFAALAAGFGCP